MVVSMHLVPHSFFHCSPDISPIKYWQIKWEKSISGPWLRKPSIWLSRLNLAVPNGMIQREGVRHLNISMIHGNGTSWKKSIKCKKQTQRVNFTHLFHAHYQTSNNAEHCTSAKSVRSDPGLPGRSSTTRWAISTICRAEGQEEIG